MGTTIASVIVMNDDCLWANVGDSRVYGLKTGSLVQLSVDDIPPGMNLSHAITQCLGGRPTRPIKPHTGRIDVTDFDGFLIVSDGISDVLSTRELEQVLLESSQNYAAALCKTALYAESKDDRSALFTVCAP